MQPDELARKQKILTALKRRKDERDLLTALIGVNADPIVEIEREELTKKIEQFKHKLHDLGKSDAKQTSLSTSREHWLKRNQIVALVLISILKRMMKLILSKIRNVDSW